MKETVVLAALIPDTAMTDGLYPAQRQAEVDKCSREKVRREKYFVWKLLEAAIFCALGEQMEDISFEKKENGKWVADKLFFSLSHSDGVVAVAVSDSAVGVDIEAVRSHREGLERHILTEREMAELSRQTEPWEYIIRRWTQKESVFKAGNDRIFEPTKIEVCEHSVRTEALELGTGRYMLSLCAPDAKEAKFEIYKFK